MYDIWCFYEVVSSFMLLTLFEMHFLLRYDSFVEGFCPLYKEYILNMCSRKIKNLKITYCHIP